MLRKKLCDLIIKDDDIFLLVKSTDNIYRANFNILIFDSCKLTQKNDIFLNKNFYTSSFAISEKKDTFYTNDLEKKQFVFLMKQENSNIK